jgi:transposase
MHPNSNYVKGGSRIAYMTQKKIKGITYYYAEEREWTKGRSCRKWQKYLGSLSKIMAAVDGVPQQPHYAEIFELGCPAAYLHVAERLNTIDVMNRIFPKRNQGVSPGLYLTVAAINRGIEATSKRSMWNWFQQTILLRRFPDVTKAALSSQRFWDNLSTMDEPTLQAAWQTLVETVIDEEQIDLSCVSYDGTNFYSFIGSFNTRCSLAKRGKNKQGRRDLRQINYALFCTRKEHIPLYFDVYEGNRHDAKEFGTIIDKFFRAFADRKPHRQGLTLVFDKGNNSEDNFSKFLEGAAYHFVGSVKPTDHKDLALISNQDPRFLPCSTPRLEDVKAFRTRKTLYGKNLTVIVTFNNNLYTAQVQSINAEIAKCFQKLEGLSGKLADRRAGRITKGKKPTVASVTKHVGSILSGQHMKTLIERTITDDQPVPSLSYSLNTTAYEELADRYLGKTLIITDHHDWTTENIILTYRSQASIEECFKHMKDRKIGMWWPMFHWTDQMICVHGFYCSLALLLRALIMKRVEEAGIGMSMTTLHEKLSGIREVLNVFHKRSHPQTTRSVVSKMDSVQKQLFNLFDMKQYLSS